MASLLSVGLFYEALSCAVSVIMLVWLVIKLIKKSELKLYINIASVSVCAIVLFYLLSAVWAVDSGMAFIGFAKFMPILLFFFIIMQFENTKHILNTLPFAAAAITIISSIGTMIPATSDFFAVDGRLAGFFQYPNTFALFLLVSELILFAKEKHKLIDYISFVVLIFGIFYTGSRTAFVLFAISNIILFFTIKNKRFKIFTVSIIGVAIIGSVVFSLVSENTNAFNRFLTISLTNSSTFTGRLLYFKDALPAILKHPFGMGYMGYYYIQQSIQTGVYSVMYIHNDFLQLLLDIGWIPCGLFIAAIIKSIFSKNTAFYKKVVLCTIVLHSCLEFNLQFIAVFFVLLLFTDYHSGKEISIKKSRIALIAVSSLMIAVCIYFGSALAFYQLGKNEISHKIYPLNTKNETILLTNEEDIAEAYKKADKILIRNEYVLVAYSAKARYAYMNGDFQRLITLKNQILEKAPFAYEEYEEYCYMLMNGIMLYEQAGDYASAEVCQNELLAVKQKLDNVPNKLSELGKRIQDQPKTELPQDIEDYIALLENSY